MRAGDIVSLRVRTADGPAELLGILVAASETTLAVRRRDGTVVSVGVDDVEAGRVVPPGPARTISAHDLQLVMAEGWRAAEVEPLGAWLLRAAHGFTGRANSALVSPDPVADLAATVTAVQEWYAARRLPARLQVVLGDEPSGLSALLDARQWEVSPATHVMTAEAGHVLRASRTATGVDVRLDARPDAGWLALYRQDEGPLPQAAVEVLTRHPQVVFASVRVDGDPVAIARAAVDGRWVGVHAVEVHPDHRRRGLATAVVVAALRWAVPQGARRAYLQVRTGNDAGIALWAHLGFQEHHDYVYWTAP